MRIYIQTGRAGDIYNSLPLAKQYFDETGNKPGFMVAQDYAPLLEAVSYVTPVPFHHPFEEVTQALVEARRRTTDIVLCQIYGKGVKLTPQTTSFCRESWLQAGAQQPWGSLPLVIDQRQKMREEALVKLLPSDKSRPLVLTALNGKSSPFPHAKPFLKEMVAHLSHDFYVMDVSNLRANRFDNMLALLERAQCLVTIDSGLLHLAHACSVPVVSLVTRSPTAWHGTPWRPNHAGRYYYDEFPGCSMAVIDRVAHVASGKYDRPKIIHVWSDRRKQTYDIDTKRRMDVAKASWVNEYATGYWQDVNFRDPARDATSIGDPGPVPFLRDMIERAVSASSKSSDIIAFTNADVCFAPGLTGHVLEKVSRRGAAYTHRWDFDRIDRPFISEAQITRGKWYCGSDAFFFTLAWWREHGNELPDMIIGREKNDEVLRQLMKFHGAVEIKRAIYHEEHESFWEKPENFAVNPGNNHNRALAASWFHKTGFQPDDWRWWPDTEGT